jgi:hypothetical protein
MHILRGFFMGKPPRRGYSRKWKVTIWNNMSTRQYVKGNLFPTIQTSVMKRINSRLQNQLMNILGFKKGKHPCCILKFNKIGYYFACEINSTLPNLPISIVFK